MLSISVPYLPHSVPALLFCINKPHQIPEQLHFLKISFFPYVMLGDESAALVEDKEKIKIFNEPALSSEHVHSSFYTGL